MTGSDLAITVSTVALTIVTLLGVINDWHKDNVLVQVVRVLTAKHAAKRSVKRAGHWDMEAEAKRLGEDMGLDSPRAKSK